MYVYMYVCIYIYMCVCVCVCVYIYIYRLFVHTKSLENSHFIIIIVSKLMLHEPPTPRSLMCHRFRARGSTNYLGKCSIRGRSSLACTNLRP